MVLSQAIVSPATVYLNDTFTVSSTLTPEESVISVVAELWGRLNAGSWTMLQTKNIGDVTAIVPVAISFSQLATATGTAEVYIKVYQSTNPPPAGPYQDSASATFTISEVTPPPPPPFPWWIPVVAVAAISIVGIGIYASRRKSH